MMDKVHFKKSLPKKKQNIFLDVNDQSVAFKAEKGN